MAKTNITNPIWVTKIDHPDHDKAIQIDPDYALAYVNRGGAYYYLRQYKLAILDYDKAIQLGRTMPRPTTPGAVLTTTCANTRKRMLTTPEPAPWTADIVNLQP